MARPLRIEYEGAVYHVTARGNERNRIFFSETDYARFLRYLTEAKKKYNIKLHCYVLMSNHYHLVIETPDGNLSRAMHLINGSYTTYINTKRKRSGHLFQGRYKSILVDTDNYLLELSRYIHLNPLRAGMVRKPEDYQHSSYSAYIKKKKDGLLTLELILGLLSRRNGNSGVEYRMFVESAIGREPDNPMKNVYGGIVLGEKRFIKEILRKIKDDHINRDDVSNRMALRSSFGIDEVLESVSCIINLSRHDIVAYKSSEQKKIAIYLMKERTGATNSEIGEVFGGMGSSAVRKVYQRFKSEMKESWKLRRYVRKIEDQMSHVRG